MTTTTTNVQVKTKQNRHPAATSVEKLSRKHPMKNKAKNHQEHLTRRQMEKNTNSNYNTRSKYVKT